MTTTWLRRGACLLLLAGCGNGRATGGGKDGVGGLDLERMLEQPRYDVYEHSGFFADGKVLQRPPAGAVARERVTGRPLLARGEVDGRVAREIPLPVAPELLALGRSRFDIFCAACHGQSGFGASVVAMNLQEDRPPSLRTPQMRAQPPGALYRHIVEGPGRMPSYAAELSVRERWAVVAYLKELQRADRPIRPEERRDSLRAARLLDRDRARARAGASAPPAGNAPGAAAARDSTADAGAPQ